MKFKYFFLIILLPLILFSNNENVKYFDKEKNIIIDENFIRTAYMFESYASIAETNGNYIEALKFYKLALKAYKVTVGENHLKTANIYYRLYLIYRNNNYQKAIDNFNVAVDIYENLKEYITVIEKLKEFINFLKHKYPHKQNDIAISYNSIAYFYKEIGKLDEGFDNQKKALEIFKKIYGKYHTHTAMAHNNIAFYYKMKREYSKALKHKKDAFDVFVKRYGILDKNLAPEYNEIGTLYLLLGNLSEALYNFEKSFGIFNREFGSNHSATLISAMNIGSIYAKVGNYEKALEICNNISLIYKKRFSSENEETALLHRNIAVIYMKLKQYDKAWIHSQKSLMIFEHYFGRQSVKVAGDYHNLGVLSFYESNYSKALNYTQISIDILNRTKEYDNLASSYFLLGAVYEKLEEYSKAVNYYQKSLFLSEKVFGKMNVNQLHEYIRIGEFYNLLGKKQESFNFSDKAFKLFFEEKSNIFLFASLKDKKDYLVSTEVLIEVLLDSGYNSNKIGYTANSWLNYKGSIFDSENSISALYYNTENKVLKNDIKKLTTSQRFLANLYQEVPVDKNIWQEKINKEKVIVSALSREIAQKSLTFQEQQNLKSINHKSITKNLKINELYIDYAKAEDYYYVFTLDSQNQIDFIQIDKNSTKKIDALIMSFREDLNTVSNGKKQQNSQEKLAQLYKLLIQDPLKEKLKNKTSLIISPDGGLRLLPFEALYDKEHQKYLIESKEIRYIPSGKEFVRLHKYAKKRVSTNNTITVFANPNFDSNQSASFHKEQIALTRGTNENIIKPFFKELYKPLLGTEREANAIDKMMDNVEIFDVNRANETNLLAVKEPKILHIATHGFFINTPNIPNPMLKSGIVLSGVNYYAKRKQGYGRVTALKLSGLNLRSTDLVVLSACETGVVDINDTDSISGLGKAFIQAGAKDVVMSLWSVDDNATKELMIDFYRGIKKHFNYSRALREAKLKMIDEGRHPFYWGGFVLNGL